MDIKKGQIPLARLFVPFGCGITAALYFGGLKYSIYITSALLLLLFLYNWLSNRYDTGYSKRWIFGTLVALFLFSAGYSFTLLHTPSEKVSDVSKYEEGGMRSFLVSIVSEPKEKEKTVKAVAEIKGIINNKRLIKVTGKVMLSFQKDTVGDTIRYGDLLVIKTQLSRVKPPMNPDEFDYQHYLEMNGIYYEGFVPKHSFHNTNAIDVPWLLYFTDRCRHRLITFLNKQIKGTEANLASAILLGYRNDLSPSVVQQFTDSGTVHVICVAGLHVGIFFWVLSLLLTPLDRFKYGKTIRTILLLILLWGYALLTGMATPVMRATVMLSFLIIGRQFSRYTNSVNTLAASALFMLLLNPFSLADTGFQLSYLSVLGILTIYPILNGIIEPANFFLRKIWELACLSASAQLAILPLSLLYFHQFPNYFVFTNLLIVPLLCIVIYSGILFFITAKIPFLCTFITWLFHSSLQLMNGIIGHSKHLPLYVTKGIFIYPVEAVLLFAFILGLFIYHTKRKYAILISTLSVLVLFLGIQIYETNVHSKQQIFAVYHVSKKQEAIFISGKQGVIPFSNIDSSDFSYHVQYHLWERGVKDTTSLHTDTTALLLSGRLAVQHNFIEFDRKKYIFIRNDDDVPDSLNKYPVHCIVISAAYKLGMEAIQNAFTFDTLIFDSSIAPMRLKKWKRECDELNIKYYDVSKQGAYIENS